MAQKRISIILWFVAAGIILCFVGYSYKDVIVKSISTTAPLSSRVAGAISSDPSQKPIPQITVIQVGANANLRTGIDGKSVAAVRRAVRNGADVNRPLGPEQGSSAYILSSPLFRAIGRQDLEIVRELIVSGANVNLRAETGRRPLMEAAEAGNEAIVRILIDKGADISAIDDFGKTAVKHAIARNHPELEQVLRKAGAKVDLFDASNGGDVEAIRILAQQGTHVDYPNSDGDTPLMLAAVRGQVAAVRELLDLGAKLDAITPRGESALLKVAWADHPDTLHVLLDRGANPNSIDANGKSALMRAADGGNGENVRLLLSRGADPNFRSQRGDTALGLNARREHRPNAPAIYRMLIEHGAHPDLIDAVSAGDAKMVRLLARQGANVNQSTSWGGTPLMLAALLGQIPVVHELIDLGANVNARTAKGATALTAARQGQHPDAVTALRAAGAQE